MFKTLKDDDFIRGESLGSTENGRSNLAILGEKKKKQQREKRSISRGCEKNQGNLLCSRVRAKCFVEPK